MVRQRIIIPPALAIRYHENLQKANEERLFIFENRNVRRIPVTGRADVFNSSCFFLAAYHLPDAPPPPKEPPPPPEEWELELEYEREDERDE